MEKRRFRQKTIGRDVHDEGAVCLLKRGEEKFPRLLKNFARFLRKRGEGGHLSHKRKERDGISTRKGARSRWRERRPFFNHSREREVPEAGWGRSRLPGRAHGDDYRISEKGKNVRPRPLPKRGGGREYIMPSKRGKTYFRRHPKSMIPRLNSKWKGEEGKTKRRVYGGEKGQPLRQKGKKVNLS